MADSILVIDDEYPGAHQGRCSRSTCSFGGAVEAGWVPVAFAVGVLFTGARSATVDEGDAGCRDI